MVPLIVSVCVATVLIASVLIDIHRKSRSEMKKETALNDLIANSKLLMENEIVVKMAERLLDKMLESIENQALNTEDNKEILSETYNIGGILSMDDLKCYEVGDVCLTNSAEDHRLYRFSNRYSSFCFENEGEKAIEGEENVTSFLFAISQLAYNHLYKKIALKAPECEITINKQVFSGKSDRCGDWSIRGEGKCLVVLYEIRFTSRNWNYVEKRK